MSSTGLHLAQLVLTWIAVAGIAARLLVERDMRVGLLVGIGGWVGLLGTIAPASLRTHAAALIVALAAATAIAGVAGWLLRSHATILLAAMAAAMPLRVPVPVDGEQYLLLIPLYGVLLVSLWSQAAREPWRSPRRPRRPGRVLLCDLAATLVVAVMALSSSWSLSPDVGMVRTALLIIPFGLAYVLMRGWLERDDVHVRPAAIAFISVMSIAAIVGLVQEASGSVWQNPKVIVANEFAPDFRTNSIFWDPNIYGRYLVLAALGLLAVGTALATTRSRMASHSRARGLLIVLLCAGLWFTYSQSSLIALAVGSLALVWVGSPRSWRVGLAICACAAVALLPTAVHHLHGSDASSRERLIEGGLRLATISPATGLGIGSFEAGMVELSRQQGRDEPRLRASHTTPVTMLVEQGVIGLAAWLLVIVGGIAAGVAGGVDPLRWWGLAAFCALAVHSLLYASFFEDPMTWLALAAVASGAVRQVRTIDAADTLTPGYDAAGAAGS